MDKMQVEKGRLGLDVARLRTEKETLEKQKEELEEEVSFGPDSGEMTPEQKTLMKASQSMSQIATGLQSQSSSMKLLKDTMGALSTTLNNFALGGVGTPAPPLTKEKEIQKIRKIQPPIFKGVPGERPEAHILRAEDWLESISITNAEPLLKIKNFRYTLDGLAREWYDQYDMVTLGNNYKKLIDDFSRYFSCQGRSMKHLHDRWRSFEFNPETDDIEDFIRNVQETGSQLHYDEQAVLNMIKSSMPTAIYSTLYDVTSLQKCITMVKDIYARNPAELHRQAQAANTGSGVPPFTAIQAKTNTADLAQITQALNALDLQTKPYKPQLAPRGSRGRGRGNGTGRRGRPFEFSGRGKAYFSNGWNNDYSQSRGNSRGRFRGRGRGNPRGRGQGRSGGQRFDKSPSRNKGRMRQPKIDEDRCLEMQADRSLGQGLPSEGGTVYRWKWLWSHRRNLLYLRRRNLFSHAQHPRELHLSR